MRAALSLLFGAVLIAQPAFEVASIKPHDIYKPDGRKLGLSISGTTVTLISMPLVSLMMEAYGVERYQISGGPGWANDFAGGVYDITAKTDGEAAPSKEQVRKMLQALLAERFHLQFHREMKDLPVYDLVIAKRGSKLKQSGDDAAFSNRQGSSGQSIKMTAIHNTIAQLVNIISPYTGRPVLDITGLTKAYDFTMEFTSEGPRSPSSPTSDEAAPSLLTALEEQLGLKLEPQKRPMEILVIDRAARPSEN